VPVWVDNDVNIMALGELRAGAGRGQQDMVVIKVGSGIGAGLVSHGRIHRGAQGSAGDIGHLTADPNSTIICRCGQRGCLGALAGGAALVRDATQAAHDGHSPLLSELLTSTPPCTPSTSCTPLNAATRPAGTCSNAPPTSSAKPSPASSTSSTPP
jgi:predicted NBD/HSP70 family sugar kinase